MGRGLHEEITKVPGGKHEEYTALLPTPGITFALQKPGISKNPLP
jgi:hypothetical protein